MPIRYTMHVTAFAGPRDFVPGQFSGPRNEKMIIRAGKAVVQCLTRAAVRVPGGHLYYAFVMNGNLLPAALDVEQTVIDGVLGVRRHAMVQGIGAALVEGLELDGAADAIFALPAPARPGFRLDRGKKIPLHDVNRANNMPKTGRRAAAQVSKIHFMRLFGGGC
jgi:hypothetical protein